MFMFTKVKKLFLILLFLPIIESCGEKKSIVSEDIIDKELFSATLADIHLIESSIQTHSVSQRDSIAKALYEHVFRIHDIEESTFYLSMEYYGKRQDLLKEIYQEVSEILSEKENSIKKAKK